MPAEDETVIVFYGVQLSPQRLATCYRLITEWFEELGYPPSNALISKEGTKGRYATFKTADAKLAKDGFNGITAIEINAVKPDPVYKWKDHFVSAFLNARGTFMHFSSLSSILPLCHPVLLSRASELIRILEPAYGIAYKMSRDQGPALYAVGIGYSKDIDDAVAKRSGRAGEEALNVSRWGHTYMPAKVWEWGYLRDIYPWNFLNRVQLSQSIENIALEKWIRDGASRGTLTPLSNGLVLWEVHEPEIQKVRISLFDAGVIFAWDKHRALVGG